MNAEAKMVGVHDRCTYKPMAVLRLSPENEREARILRRAGFGARPEEYAFFYDMDDGECTYDPFKLTDQMTCGEAARHIREISFDALDPGALIDCEHLRGEAERPMRFEEEFDYPYTRRENRR